jgi:putative addiction module component (TIGR02574 family)
LEFVYLPTMPMTIDQIAEEALALSKEERALLADRLAGSLDTEEQKRLEGLWSIEAKRRLEEIRSGEVKTIPGPEALARVRRSVGR